MEVAIEPDAQSVAECATRLLAADIESCVSTHGVAHWVAAGGTTPGLAYGALARRTDLPWDRVKILMGDERCVPIGDESSNWTRLAAELLDVVGVRDDLRLRPPAELGAESAASEYESTIELLSPEARSPRFDHAWIGVGEDGHTLSLFPSHPSLAPTDRLVVPVHNAPKPPPDRISFTFDALEGVGHLVILACGASKQDAVAGALGESSALPVARAARTVESAGGRVTWLLDQAAAASLAA
jgi:6-phosphogluconolactonase